MFEFDGRLYDCRLILKSIGSVLPGAQIEAPIVFLDPSSIFPKLRAGDRFRLLDPRPIAKGIILSLAPHV
jgi:hypothetical protein